MIQISKKNIKKWRKNYYRITTKSYKVLSIDIIIEVDHNFTLRLL